MERADVVKVLVPLLAVLVLSMMKPELDEVSLGIQD